MEILIKLRKERGLTNEDMGKVIGVAKSTYNHWEIGRSEPDIKTLIKLADFFCVTVDYLIGAPVKANANTGEILDAEEKELIKYWRGMDKPGKNAILVTAQSFYNNAQKQAGAV